MKEIDVRGLSCPEPIMQVAKALKNFPGEELKVLLSEAHSYKNVENFVKDKGRSFQGGAVGLEYELIIRA